MKRAGKTPSEFAEIVASRVQDATGGVDDIKRKFPASGRVSGEHLHLRLILIWTSVSLSLLHESPRTTQSTEGDADGLRAIEISAEVLIKESVCPGLPTCSCSCSMAFDFTPVQGEMLKLLIPQIPEVVVNLNKDDAMPNIQSLQ